MSLNIETLVGEIHDYLERAFKPVAEDMRDLRRRVEELERSEKNLADAYRGAFKRQLTYCRGELATHRGALWLAIAPETSETPGDGPAWKMIVKSGGDL